jgi:hypothetical protein
MCNLQSETVGLNASISEAFDPPISIQPISLSKALPENPPALTAREYRISTKIGGCLPRLRPIESTVRMSSGV